MWAKRFPVPEFDRHALKNLNWTPPEVTDGVADGHYGCAAMTAPAAFSEKFSFQGEFLLAVACSLPNQTITVSGNSYAWPIHRVVITDSLDVETCEVIADWKTPRPMNTRLGPNNGITVNSEMVYVLIGHQFAEHWIGNRIMLDNEWPGGTRQGFRILSSSESEINDFHDAVVYFEWA